MNVATDTTLRTISPADLSGTAISRGLPAEGDSSSSPQSRHAQRVCAAYTSLNNDFSHFVPSASFRAAFNDSVVAEAARRIASGESLRLLDIGCGHGTWLEELLHALPALAAMTVRDPRRAPHPAAANPSPSYLGIDLTPARIEQARERLTTVPWATFQVADAEAYAPPQPVDVILVVEVLAHVPRDRHSAWIRRLAGWLSPGGCIIVIDKERFSKHALRLTWDRCRRRVLPDGLRRWLPARVANRLGRAYYFPAHFAELASTIAYPSFAALVRHATRAGLAPSVAHATAHGLFHTLIARR